VLDPFALASVLRCTTLGVDRVTLLGHGHARHPLQLRRLGERWEALVAPRPADAYTLAHVDYHPKQMFFPHQGRGRFAVFDWQGVCVSVGAMDLQRALLTTLDAEQLAAHE